MSAPPHTKSSFSSCASDVSLGQSAINTANTSVIIEFSGAGIVSLPLICSTNATTFDVFIMPYNDLLSRPSVKDQQENINLLLSRIEALESRLSKDEICDVPGVNIQNIKINTEPIPYTPSRGYFKSTK